MQNKFIIDAKEISFGYGYGPVIDRLNIKMKYGQVVVITGRSGVGKSTLLNILNGNINRFYGELNVCGVDLKSKHDFAAFKRHVATISQHDTLLYDFSVIENVAMSMMLYGYSRRHSMEKATSILDYIGMNCCIHQSVDSLSSCKCLSRSII